MTGDKTTRPAISNFGELKRSGYFPKSVKQEIRENLIKSIKEKGKPFEGVLGY